MVESKSPFEEILAIGNQKILVDVATQIFVNVVGTAARADLIEEPDESESELPRELADTGPLFSKPLRLSREFGSTEVGYQSLGFEWARRKLREPYTNLFRRRAQQIPKLYGALREYRNTLQHDFDGITVRQTIGLCGTILSILDLAVKEPKNTAGLLTQCESILADAVEALTGDETHRPNETMADVAVGGNDEFALIREEDERQPEEANVLEDSLSTLTDRVNRAISISEEVLSGSRQISSSVDRLVDKLSAAAYVAQESDPTFDDDPEFTFYGNGSVTSRKLTPSMAMEKLRELRDRIRREAEDSLEPWENICMLNPIVSEAVKIAATRGLTTISDWRALPDVSTRLQRSDRKMEIQIAKYGDEMMEIYGRVER